MAACALLLAATVQAAELRLPILTADAPAAAGYLPDQLEIRLAPGAAARVPAARRAAMESAEGATELGVPALDRVTRDLGAWIEPEFRGEAPPAEGSGDIDFTAFYVVHLPATMGLANALDRFASLPEVVSAEPIAVLPVSATPNDSLFSTSYWFRQTSRQDIHAPEAWDLTTGDPRVVIAILDTGILPDHPDLGGTVAGGWGQLWTNAEELAGGPGVDDDGNGFVDDTWGWDFVDLGSNNRIPAGEDWDLEDNDPRDFAGHGTAVAGVAGALSNNGIGITGTAWNVRLMALRVGYSRDNAPLGTVDMRYAAQAIRYATRMGAHVINCSFATDNINGLYYAASAAIRAGVVVVSAAGNDGQIHELADREDVIAVAATDAGDFLANFSNRGPFVDLAAPGDEIVSTFVQVPRPTSGLCQPAYGVGLDGTSFSAPMVSGVAALVQSLHLQRSEPLLDPMGMLLRLRETTDDIAALNGGLGAGYGTGRLNASRALSQPSTSTALRAGARTVGPGVSFARVSNGETFEAWATEDRNLIVARLDGDTVTVVPLGGVPASGVAAADLAPGRPPGFFVSLTGNQVAGFDADAHALSGWPVTAPGTVATLSMPALGDLDGDGAIEVICASSNGRVFAWRASGALVTGFPRTIAGGIVGAVALVELDGSPGLEIVAADELGNVHALDGNGAPLDDWPVSLGIPITAPIVTRAANDSIAIVVAAGDRVYAIGRGTNVWFTAPLGATGAFATDLAAGDLDGDGRDEIVALTGNPTAIAAFDDAGAPLAGFAPRVVDATPTGPPVIGRLSGGSGRHQNVSFMTTLGLVSFDENGDSLLAFPRPGGAGRFPSIVNAGAKDRVLAGAAGDSLIHLFVYDGEDGSGADSVRPWFTPRGNFARTGSRLVAPPLSAVDDLAPLAVVDLSADSIEAHAITLAWHAPGDDGASGRAASYELRVATSPLDAANFATGSLVPGVPAPRASGGLERMRVAGLQDSVRYWFALKTHDDAGNASALSNVVEAITSVLPPPGPRAVSLLLRRQPSRVPVDLQWTGMGGANQRIQILDLFGRKVRTLGLDPVTEGTQQWNGRDDRGRSVPAGVYLARLTSGSFRAHTRIVLLP